MKRVFLWAFVAALLFLLLFFGFNLFDSPTPPGSAAAGGTRPAATADLGAGNAFFVLWGFAEAPEVDPASAGYAERLRGALAAAASDAPARRRLAAGLAQQRADFGKYWQGANLYFPRLQGEDAVGHFAVRRAEVAERQERFAVLLRRYRALLHARRIADFTPPGRGFPTRSSQLAANTARLDAAARVLEAVDGAWLQAGGELLAAAEAGLRLVAVGRASEVNALGRLLVDLALRSLASLLDRGECPPELAHLVLERMPDRPAADFGTEAVRSFALAGFAAALERIKGSRIVEPFLLRGYFRDPTAFFALERLSAIAGPRSFAAFHALASFFVQKNESLALMREFWNEMGELERTPPWRWRDPPLRRLRASGATSRPFWWLRNPVGKMLVRSSVPFHWPVLVHYVYRSHELKARWDLLRLLAAARLRAGAGGRMAEDDLRRLLAAAPERDPFSGGPYRFDPARRVLYSIGANAVDDNGRERPELWRDSDIAVSIQFIDRSQSLDGVPLGVRHTAHGVRQPHSNDSQ